MVKEWEKMFDKSLDLFARDVLDLPASRKLEAYERLKALFDRKVLEIKNTNTEIEYGRDMEERFNMVLPDPYKYRSYR